MKKLLNKEIKLAASPLTFIFLAFAFMTFFPGYPILMGSFFISMGLFYSFRYAREANDILYSVLLPLKKADVVKSKYLFAVDIELSGFLLMAICTFIRMSLLKDSVVYRDNPLMDANPVYLAFALIIFAAFNWFFINGFFKTAYDYGKSMIYFIIVAMLLMGLAESLHFFPGMEWTNSIAAADLPRQLSILLATMLLYAGVTFAAFRRSQASFEKIDL